MSNLVYVTLMLYICSRIFPLCPSAEYKKDIQTMKYITIIMLLILGLSSCETQEQKDKKALLLLMTQIRDDYDEGRDSSCLANIDTLRSRYPKAVKERKECLTLFQKASLRKAQKELEAVDKALLDESARYEKMKQDVEAKKAAGIATAEELTALTRKRMHRDSLQTKFDVLCAEIKYIHKRQKQNEEEADK